MTKNSIALVFALPLSLSLACGEQSAGDDVLQYNDDSVEQSESDVVYERALVVDGAVVLYGEYGLTKRISLTVDAFVALGFHNRHKLLIGAHPRALLPESEDNGGYDLYLLDVRSSVLTPLTSGQEVTRASFQPHTGRIIAGTRQMEIVEIDPANPEDIEVVVDHAITPALSPDGTQLAYGRLPADWTPGALPETIDLHVLDLATELDRELTSGFDDIEPVWSPDGQRLLFLSGARTGIHSFWAVDLTDEVPEQLTNIGLETIDDSFVPSPSFNTEVAWSDDGQRLLFGAHYTDAGEIHTLDFSADPLRPTHAAFGPGMAPQWQADGTLTAITTDIDDEIVLTSISTETGERVTLARTPGTLPTVPMAPAEFDNHQTPSPEELDAMLNGSPRAADSTVRFQFPMNNYYGVNYHYDNNAAEGWRKDKNCGTQTYDGHRGTDFSANYGNNLYAAASGSIYHRVDGCATTGGWGNWCGNGFGNHVRMDHGGGWKSIYGHMTHGTVTGWGWKGCGSYLGVSGSSGNSTGPHLHFEVIRYGYPYDDPYAGPCSGPESFWTHNWYCQ